MTLGLLLALAAPALADDDARLLGPDPAGAVVAQAASPGIPWTSWLPLLLAGGVAAGTFAWQRRPRGDGALEAPSVENVGRHSLGGPNLLHLVDVEDRSGRVRRLVVATSNQGVATLLADLGPGEPELRREESLRRLPTFTEATEPREARDVRREWERSFDGAPRTDPRREAERRAPAVSERREDRTARWREADLDAPEPPIRGDDRTTQERRAQALSLIDEVVGGAGQSPGRRAGLRA